MKEKNIILAARIMSMIFTPFYLPLVGLVALFLFSYMSLLPLAYKLPMLLTVYISTILMPSLLIHLYRRFQGWTSKELGRKERRIILVAALVIQMVCALINVWWKISTHTAGIGGLAGGLVVYSIAFSFNPIWWLAFVILLAGMVGTARMILRQHTLAQVVTGFLVGVVCALFII